MHRCFRSFLQEFFLLILFLLLDADDCAIEEYAGINLLIYLFDRDKIFLFILEKELFLNNT